jgi:nicotinamidase-related amidase
MSSTYASVVIEAEYQAAAQADTSDLHFTIGYSSDGNEPITYYIDSGWWYNDELDAIVNDYVWPKQVFFGNDLQSVLTQLDLQIVNVEFESELVEQ